MAIYTYSLIIRSMESYYTKIIETLIVVCAFIAVRISMSQLINKTSIRKVVHKSRAQLIRRAINLALLFICFIVIMTIWGIKQSELAVFVGSILTIVGVAFFAQWSLLSNITSSIIIFFGHSVKTGDDICIMETKDYDIRGTILNIDLFFIRIKLTDSEDEITMPNNVFILKTVRKINNPHSVDQSEINIQTDQS